jgi:hypothetical protein
MVTSGRVVVAYLVVFIGKIGRGQKDEKARLQKELDRDLRVLAEIDAATGTAA